MANHYREIERIVIQAVRDTVGRIEEIMGQQQQQADIAQQQDLGDVNANQYEGGDGDFGEDIQQQVEEVEQGGQQQLQQVEQPDGQQGGQQQTRRIFSLWLRGCDMEEQCQSCRRANLKEARLHRVEFEEE